MIGKFKSIANNKNNPTNFEFLSLPMIDMSLRSFIVLMIINRVRFKKKQNGLIILIKTMKLIIFFDIP